MAMDTCVPEAKSCGLRHATCAPISWALCLILTRPCESLRIKSGSIDLERADSATDAAMGDYGTTSYGQQVYPMLKACLGGPSVTSTGALPCHAWPYGYEGPIW